MPGWNDPVETRLNRADELLPVESAVPEPPLESIQTMTFLGSYAPRKCGIATFTQDLRDAVAGELGNNHAKVIAVDDSPHVYQYDSSVEFNLPQHDRQAYRLAADLLNVNHVDVVSIQHEYGIYGGDDGCYVLDLLNRIRMPAITTLHTVLRHPSDGQREVLNEIISQSARVVVMSQRARQILQETYSAPENKIAVIPHGIHDTAFVDPHYYADQFDMKGKRVLLTFGLLGPGKGIETVIRSLPRIVKTHPDVVYMVVGATHPHVLRREGEKYRDWLKSLAAELGVAQHVQFVNQYCSLDELKQYLGLAEVYVVPYPNTHQITSGTLAYALGAGKAIVSTPIWHAEELLDDGRGVLFPVNDHDALAEKVAALLDDDDARNAMRKKAYLHGRQMIWSEVGKSYVQLARQVITERRYGRLQPIANAYGDLPPVIEEQPNLDHLERMTDSTGMLQHAFYGLPDRRHGYCTDDNARALMIALAYDEQMSDPRALKLADRYLTFLVDAYNWDRHRFRNFMSYDRRWLEDIGSDDSHARAIWALGYTVAMSKMDAIRMPAYRLFKDALPAAMDSASPRTLTFTMLGLANYRRAIKIDAHVNRYYQDAAARLLSLFDNAIDPAWPWPEPKLTYDNARLPQALIQAGHDLDEPRMLKRGLHVLDWLVDLQTDEDGIVSLVSHVGWTADPSSRALFDQQPVEAAAMVDACALAYRITGQTRWFDLSKRFYLWFLGNNVLGLPVRDSATGGSSDGLQAAGLNFNQGAESTLALLSSSLAIRDLYRRAVDLSSQVDQDAVA